MPVYSPKPVYPLPQWMKNPSQYSPLNVSPPISPVHTNGSWQMFSSNSSDHHPIPSSSTYDPYAYYFSQPFGWPPPGESGLYPQLNAPRKLTSKRDALYQGVGTLPREKRSRKAGHQRRRQASAESSIPAREYWKQRSKSAKYRGSNGKGYSRKRHLIRNLSRRLSKSIQAAFGRLRKHKLSPLLEYNGPSDYPLCYDIRDNPLETSIQLFGVGGVRFAGYVDLIQTATSPPVQEMSLWHPRLPGNILIRASEPVGITLEDILYQLHEQLSMPSHYYEQDSYRFSSFRDIGRTFSPQLFRFSRYEPTETNGMRGIDMLGDRVLFLGLVKSRGGRWEIKTAEV